MKGEKKIHFHCLADYPGYDKNKQNDKALVTDLHRLVFSRADLLIGHNIDRFDARKSRAKFLVHGLPPVPPVKTIDTLKLARRVFKFNSNRLADIGNDLGLGGKVVHTGWNLWKRCIDGDAKAWAMMRRYNKRDVDLLEKVYERLAPWHPNPPILMSGECCPSCHSSRLQRRGWNVAKKSRTPRMHCQDCGQWSAGQREIVK